MNYVITVYRTTGNQQQRFNADTIEKANNLYKSYQGARFVHKVEIAVILEAWTPRVGSLHPDT